MNKTNAVVVTLVLLSHLLIACVKHDQHSANQQIKNRGEGKDNWWQKLPRSAWGQFERIPQSQDWFEVYRVLPGVFAIYEPGQFDEVISYLIVGTDKALLFDTGLGIGDMKRVVTELTELVPIVINSHTHYDHIGGNYQFDTIYGTDTEYTKVNSYGKSHEEVQEFVAEGWIWKQTPKNFSVAEYHIKPFQLSKFISDGEKIELGKRTLEVVMTPGHAPDALCLLDREHRLLFTGDTFYPASLYAHLPASDFDAYAQTAAMLGQFFDEVDKLLPAHNEPLVGRVYLRRMHEGFKAIQDSTIEFIVTDGNHEYMFEGFSIIVNVSN